MFLWKEVVHLIGKTMGKPVKLDEVTSFASRGRYARISVKIDINKPLLTKVRLKNDFINIEYEGLPTICYSCGRIDHRLTHCPYTIVEPTTKENGLVSRRRIIHGRQQWPLVVNLSRNLCFRKHQNLGSGCWYMGINHVGIMGKCEIL